MRENSTEIALSVRGLRKSFPVKGGTFIQRDIAAVKAVDDISFDLRKGKRSASSASPAAESPRWDDVSFG